MSSRDSCKTYSSDEDEFFGPRSPTRSKTRVISRKSLRSPISNDYSEDGEIDATTRTVSTGSGRSTSIRNSGSNRSLSPHTTSPLSTLTAKSRQSNSVKSLMELHSTVQRPNDVYGRRKTVTRGSRDIPKYGSAPVKKSPIVQLMLSSKQQEINDLLNRLSNTNQQISSAEKENKLLRKLQRRQDKALIKFEDTRTELPGFLSKNSEDQRKLKRELRKTQENKRSLESKLNENFEEMQKMESALSRLKKLAYDKTLGERSELSRQLADAESSLVTARQNIEDLNETIESKVSGYTKQLKIEKQKHRDTLKKLSKAEMQYIDTNSTLKEKERAVQKGNIYSLRNRDIADQSLLPLISSTEKQPLPAITSSKSPVKHNEGEDNAESQTDQESIAFCGNRSQKTTSVFLTADFDSPSNSFVIDSVKLPDQPKAEQQIEDEFARDLKKTEEEIKKLQAAVQQKASILAKLQDIEQTTPSNQEIVKIYSAKNSIDHQTSISSHHDTTNNPGTFSQQTTSDSFASGGYAPSIHGASVSQRRSPMLRKQLAVPTRDESDVEEPLFDLSSGKDNRKPDLLTQLFGNVDTKG